MKISHFRDVLRNNRKSETYKNIYLINLNQKNNPLSNSELY